MVQSTVIYIQVTYKRQTTVFSYVFRETEMKQFSKIRVLGCKKNTSCSTPFVKINTWFYKLTNYLFCVQKYHQAMKVYPSIFSHSFTSTTDQDSVNVFIAKINKDLVPCVHTMLVPMALAV